MGEGFTLRLHPTNRRRLATGGVRELIQFYRTPDKVFLKTGLDRLLKTSLRIVSMK